MHYQVSRNGQMYGPYTLDDLRRYVASGNVLLTDLVKSEGMAEWMPVSQLLNGPAAETPFSTPLSGQAAAGSYDAATQGGFPAQPGFAAAAGGYPGPGYAPALGGASQYPDAPNLHWGLYLLFAILTCGLFSKVFTLIQAAWLRRVQPNSNGLFFYIGLYVLWVISLFAGAGRAIMMISHPGMFPHTSPGRSGLSLLYFILLIVTRFVMSASLEEHFNGPEPIGLKLNPVLTFFFGGVYFQSQLNRINAMKQAARYGAPRAF